MGHYRAIMEEKQEKRWFFADFIRPLMADNERKGLYYIRLEI
jgi:hypothetical protein